jgi:hypothetical protein
MRALMLLLTFLLFVLGTSILHARIARIPDDFPTIQAGIDECVDGDTVLVGPGVYTGDGNRDIDCTGKALFVTSMNGPEETIIDCGGSPAEYCRGFNFHCGEDGNAVVQGFTIRNGYQTNGGGIACMSSSPTITGNIITGNSTREGSYGRGGGIYCYESSPTITDNVIRGNHASSFGGGISCWQNSSPIITGNTITGNTTNDGSGGGIYCTNSSATITGNTITGNVAGAWAGGMSLYLGSYVIRDNLVANNTAGASGGGIDFWYATAVMENCTISENTAAEAGGGITVADNNEVTATNTVFWNNRAALGDEVWIGYYSSTIPSTLTLSYSDVEGGDELIFVDSGCTLVWGEGMLNKDPLFLSPDREDYRLFWGSPCIDTGHPDYQDPDHTRSDMGARPFDQNEYITLYLTPDVTAVERGDRLGVTYTLINRWPQVETFILVSQLTLPNGRPFGLLGPLELTLPGGSTEQVYMPHDIPLAAPIGSYEYSSETLFPVSAVPGEDQFTFRVVGYREVGWEEGVD